MHFFGLCDQSTLETWKPCPFLSTNGCSSETRDVFQTFCNIHDIATTDSHCNCTGAIRKRQLEPMIGKIFFSSCCFSRTTLTDFPTCFLGGYCQDKTCTIAQRRNTRKLDHMTNNVGKSDAVKTLCVAV